MLKKKHGHIVAMSSMLGVQAFPQTADYAASKAAILRLMESLSQELRQDSSNIHTTSVVPFMVDTGLFQGAKVRSVHGSTGQTKQTALVTNTLVFNHLCR